MFLKLIDFACTALDKLSLDSVPRGLVVTADVPKKPLVDPEFADVLLKVASDTDDFYRKNAASHAMAGIETPHSLPCIPTWDRS